MTFRGRYLGAVPRVVAFAPAAKMHAGNGVRLQRLLVPLTMECAGVMALVVVSALVLAHTVHNVERQRALRSSADEEMEVDRIQPSRLRMLHNLLNRRRQQPVKVTVPVQLLPPH
ncbi:hypothetical protein FVE85_3576 [Porphyridium purpureum]|uniref:Transmembrane protein n=1 Tax=Porphyridium purpureum TaxID=35688 RepID=A0A5J4YLL3_PORPP|nr:hypothetical protein FVE85_3576 [Porphyridium purpureum]|eukprot:POR8083..scf249_10